jgi:diguanylate cyclase (GGDEF)-like protein
MKPELEARLKSLGNLPSPAGVGARIIELAQDPDVDMGEVARAVGMDPALASKILRIANSAIYAQRRRSDNLRQALVVLGLNATLTLALSFSLVKALQGGTANGLDYPRYWRRALLGATAARTLGEAAGHSLGEELFLAGLLQDVGMIALDRAMPALYRIEGLRQERHGDVCALERRQLGLDHGQIGAWLMRQWNLSDRLCRAVEASHRVEPRYAATPDEVFQRAVAMSGPLADLFLESGAQADAATNELAQQSSRVFRMDARQFGDVMTRVSSLIPEIEAIFETDIVAEPDAIVDQAREILMIRNLHALREVNTLRVAADSLSARATQLEAETQHDALTGVHNRTFLERFLEQEFRNSLDRGWPLSVAFCDLDHFKAVNDTYGHQAGDRILQATGEILRCNTRESDVVARYGGEEFVIVLPATGAEDCGVVSRRIVEAFRRATHDLGGRSVSVTVSIGCATLTAHQPYPDHAALLHAADQALYAAKRAGRNQVVPGELRPAARLVK